MKLHRDLGITQKMAWHLAHRMRETWNECRIAFAGPVEVDATSLVRNREEQHGGKKLRVGRGTVDKTAGVGIKNRDTTAATG